MSNELVRTISSLIGTAHAFVLFDKLVTPLFNQDRIIGITLHQNIFHALQHVHP